MGAKIFINAEAPRTQRKKKSFNLLSRGFKNNRIEKV